MDINSDFWWVEKAYLPHSLPTWGDAMCIYLLCTAASIVRAYALAFSLCGLPLWQL